MPRPTVGVLRGRGGMWTVHDGHSRFRDRSFASKLGQSAQEGARFALWKNPEDLTGRQHATLAEIAQTLAVFGKRRLRGIVSGPRRSPL